MIANECVRARNFAVFSDRFLLQVTGHRSQVTGHRSQVTGHRSQVTGHEKVIKQMIHRSASQVLLQRFSDNKSERGKSGKALK